MLITKPNFMIYAYNCNIKMTANMMKVESIILGLAQQDLESEKYEFDIKYWANEINISEKTVLNNIKKISDIGYIIPGDNTYTKLFSDLTYNLHNETVNFSINDIFKFYFRLGKTVLK